MDICRSKLSQNNIDTLKARLMAKSEPNGKGCLEFNGTKQQNNVYRFLKVNIKDVDGRPLTGSVRVHRLSYVLHAGPIDNDVRVHVSHLCHNKACIDHTHLSLEPAATNAQRQLCVDGKHCLGHVGYSNCIFNA